MTILIYRLGISCYHWLVALLSMYLTRARLFTDGRKDWERNVAQKIQDDPSDKAWFHCASLGEFEQARPLIEALRKQEPSLKVIVTFFSPSGYEIRKNYSGAEYIFYLPKDSPANARKLLNLFKPKLVFFVKYEFWYFYMSEIVSRQVPFYIVSAVFREDHFLFRWYGKPFLELLQKVSGIFTQDEASVARLAKHGIHNAVVAGDTRYDRVWETCKNPKDLPAIRQFKGDRLLLVAGSSYAEEEKLIASLPFGQGGLAESEPFKQVKMVIAPHHIGEARLKEIESTFSAFSCTRYSKAAGSGTAEVLIIDNIGLLSSVYSYADMAFIGGAFGRGLHNVLEAAVFGVPVFFGPHTDKFPEAGELMDEGIAFRIETSAELQHKLSELLTSPEKRKLIRAAAEAFIGRKRGATQRILTHLLS